MREERTHEAAVVRRSVVHMPGDPPPRRSATASRKHTRQEVDTNAASGTCAGVNCEEEMRTRRPGPGGRCSRVQVTHNARDCRPSPRERENVSVWMKFKTTRAHTR
ncbi:uncharacterized protein LOC144016234 isoform X1 [Festucalex cinctus]